MSQGEGRSSRCLFPWKKVGRYPYAPVHVQGSDLPPVASGQKKVPVFDAGTNASHDVNQV